MSSALCDDALRVRASRDFVDGIDSAGYIVPLSVALVVGSSCVLATLVPALRASQVDPMVTLKAE